MRHKVNGVFVAVTRIYPEGQYWRWYIRDINGNEYLDGGNYLTQGACEDGLQAAYDSEDLLSNKLDNLLKIRAWCIQ